MIVSPSQGCVENIDYMSLSTVTMSLSRSLLLFISVLLVSTHFTLAQEGKFGKLYTSISHPFILLTWVDMFDWTERAGNISFQCKTAYFVYSLQIKHILFSA